MADIKGHLTPGTTILSVGEETLGSGSPSLEIWNPPVIFQMPLDCMVSHGADLHGLPSL